MRRLVLLGCTVLLTAVEVVLPPSAAAATCEPGSGARLAGQDLRGRDLSQANLRCADLRGADLEGVDLEQADLTGADLAGAHLAGATLTQATMTGADLSGATLTGTKLDQTGLGQARLTGAHAEHADFGQATLTGATLTGLDARSADFSQATLSGDDLTDVDLTDATLDQATANDVRLERVRLGGASLVELHDSGATVANASGLVPVDALAGVMAAIAAWFAVWRRWRRTTGLVDRVTHRRALPGRILAATVAAVALAGIVVAVLGAWSWIVAPPNDGTIFAPLASLLLGGLSGAIVIAAVRRVRGPVAAAVLALLGAAGVYLWSAAAVAGVLTMFEVTAFVNSCAGPDCLGGAARGWAGMGIGIALIVVVAVASGQRALSRTR